MQATEPGCAYLPWPQERNPDDYFCFKYIRTVTNDNTLPFNNQRLQIPPGPQRQSYARARVELRHYLDGRLAVFHHGQHLVTFQPATSAPPRVGLFQPATPFSPPPAPQAPKRPPAPTQTWKPPADHPWRQYGKPLKGKKLG